MHWRTFNFSEPLDRGKNQGAVAGVLSHFHPDFGTSRGQLSDQPIVVFRHQHHWHTVMHSTYEWVWLSVSALAQTLPATDPLPSWNDGAAKEAISGNSP